MANYRAGERDPYFYGSSDNGRLPHLAYGATFHNDNDPRLNRIYLTGEWSNRDSYYVAEHYDNGLPTTREYFGGAPGAEISTGLDVFMQGDGIVVLGAFTLPGRAGYFPFLSKVDRDLHLVTSFGNEGYVLLGSDSGVHSVEGLDQLVARVTPDRIYILAAGGASQPNQVISLDLQGRLDPGFNGTGVLDITRQPTHDLYLRSLEIPEPYNRIVLAGHEAAVGDARPAGVFVGVTRNGTLDQDFGPGGFVRPATPQAGVEVFGTFIKHQLNWAVVGAGKGLAAGRNSGLLMSVNQDGSKDIDLNGGEPLLLGDDRGELTWLHGAQDPERGVIVAGYRLDPENSDRTWPAFGRIGPNAEFDESFGEEGVVTIEDFASPGLPTNRVQATFVHTDNRLVVIGFALRSGVKSFMLGYLLKDTDLPLPSAATDVDSPLTSA